MDLTGDYLFFDGTETVTHLTTDGQSSTVLFALRQDVKIQDASGVWVMDSTRSVWHLADAEMTHDPAAGHKLTQTDDTAWIINDVTYSDIIGMWECAATKVQTSG